jgi:hypothetical protein
MSAESQTLDTQTMNQPITSIPAALPVPEVTPMDQLGEVLQQIHDDARTSPRNYLSDLRVPYGGE